MTEMGGVGISPAALLELPPLFGARYLTLLSQVNRDIRKLGIIPCHSMVTMENDCHSMIIVWSYYE